MATGILHIITWDAWCGELRICGVCGISVNRTQFIHCW